MSLLETEYSDSKYLCGTNEYYHCRKSPNNTSNMFFLREAKPIEIANDDDSVYPKPDNKQKTETN